MILKFLTIALAVGQVMIIEVAGSDLCPRPTNPDNGKVKIDRGVIKKRTAARFSCNENYGMKGSGTRRCQETGEWTGEQPICERLCEFPPLLQLDALRFEINPNSQNPLPVSDGKVVLQKIIFRCSDGYKAKGATSIRCLANGNWDHKPPICEKSVTDANSTTARKPPRKGEGCPKPKDSPHGRYGTITIPVGATSVPTEGPFPVNTDIHFQCEQNYVLGHGGSQRRTVRTCLRSGEWSTRDPNCFAVCGKSDQPMKPQVVGGWAASPNEFPWQAALTQYRASSSDSDYRRIICGAVLLSERWVVTAAHCVNLERSKEQRKESELLVLFGKHFYNRNLDDNDVNSRKLAQIITHENYDPSNFDYDVALIHLETPVSFNDKVLPVCLPSPSSTLDVETNGTVSGWGFIDQDKTIPKQLMTSQLPVVDSKKCEKNYNIKLTDRMFCAGFDQGGTNTCEGDSGGPFVVWDVDHYVLEGLVSWGNTENCAGPGYYGAFVRVSKLVDWILGWIGPSMT